MSLTASTSFEALGTYVYVGTRDRNDVATANQLASVILRDIDDTCSRFREDSDLSRVNRVPGQWVDVDPLLVQAIEVACEAARQTDGLVNPLLGRPLVFAGYDHDFEMLDGGQFWHSSAEPWQPAPDVEAWADIELDAQGGVKIPVGTAVDLGATAKAWAADLIATAFVEHLDGPGLISLGGDLRISKPDGEPWLVGVSEKPQAPHEQVIGLNEGGLATSSTQVRQWRRGGVRMHHVIDPRTGRPVQEVWRTASATGPTCTAANVASTAAIVLGRQAPDWLNDHDVSARLVAVNGTVAFTGQWPEPSGAN